MFFWAKYLLAQNDHVMFVINGIDRLFYPKTAPLVIDLKQSLTLLCRSLEIEQFPKGCFDGESSLFFYQIVNHFRDAKGTVSLKSNRKIRQLSSDCLDDKERTFRIINIAGSV
ncbi:MAG: hypothetical protein SRB2_00877 [Desulfobacteraceae bacterium Eth-SRB2]|nr:MAG: hypothetical protein SRB2_00877 [Desulfobacteraceae bacterium Eth-SRB2]